MRIHSSPDTAGASAAADTRSDALLGPTIDETLTVHISQLFADDDRTFVGAGLQVPRAAAILAQQTHAPNLRLSMGMVSVDLRSVQRMEPFRYGTDSRVTRWAESNIIHDEIFARPDLVITVFFVGGMQVDLFGNTNLIGLKDDAGRLKLRGPGSFGTTSMAHYARRHFVYLDRHDRHTLVPKVDYISALGYGDGGDHRERLGMNDHNIGPELMFTPLGIFDFDTLDHRARLIHTHAGVSVDDVRDCTGFDFPVAPGCGPTPQPSMAHLTRLRRVIDVEGALRRPTTSGPTR